MNAFTLELASATQHERIQGVCSFVGTDASGRFGILPGHEPASTVLSHGLARYRLNQPGDDGAEAAWRYLALPGGVLRFADGVLSIATRRYVRGDRLDQVRQALEHDIREDTRQQADLRHNLQQLEENLMQRLWRLERT